MNPLPPGTRHGDPQATAAAQRALDDARDLERSLHDPDWFGVVFDRYFADIHGYVARRLGTDAADDIAADTFLTAFRTRERFDDGRGIVRGWRYGIATNHMRRYRRGEVRTYRAMQRARELPAEDGHADLVADRVTAGAAGGRLAAALAELSRGDRDVLLLVALGGLSLGEVALGIPYGTVGSRLSRARRLRAGLAGIAPFGDEEDQENG